MGLSSKQVSGNHGIDWNQTLLQARTLELSKPTQMRRQQGQNQHQSEPLKCPRCDSTNTKFCYYNNYNKSQPRHFCKTCKRHWTKGGTLRNVPVGGGRKNKRLKTSKKSVNSTPATTTTITATGNTSIGSISNSNKVNPQMAIGAEKQKQKLPVILGDRNDIYGIHYQALPNPPSSGLQQNSFNCGNLNSGSSYNNNGALLFDSALSQPLNHKGLNFSYSTASSSYIDTHSSSISTSFQPPYHAYNYTREVMEDSTITTTMPNTSSSLTRPWSALNASSGIDMASYWKWEDMDTFVSDDLIVPWDDSEIKP